VDLGLSEEQHQLVSSFSSLLGKESSVERVRAAEPHGFDERLWRSLVDTGAVTMGVPEARGGWGASLLDLALVAEEVGRALAPAPLIDVQVVARLLGAVGSGPALDALVAVLEGDQLVTTALRAPRDGVAGLVPAGAVADAVVVLDGTRLLLVPVVDARPVANLAASPLADVDVHDGVELVAGDEAVARFEAALDEWLVLTAAALVGIGAAAHEQGCAYAMERRAFGVPIGTFQGVAHPLADDATRLDGARLLARKAAWSIDGDAARARELAAMAFAVASEAAEKATYDALHVHGGYGFTLECDVQLHHRRARGWPRVWGDAEQGFRRAALARYGFEGGAR
jgi:alkylation response protein AidB-like acyl-CoA dehydrogenase